MRRCHRPVQRLFAVLVTATAAAATASLLGAGAAQAAPAEGTVRDANVQGAIKDHFIVVFKSGRAESGRVAQAAGDLAHRYGGKVRDEYDTAVHGFSAQLSDDAAKRLAADPAVDYVEQDRTVTISQANPPSWGLDRIDQPSLPLSHTYTAPNTASNVHAYIIDTGVRISHTDFGGRASNGYDFVDNDAVANDCNGHGTHVAGTVGGSTYGVAKAVKLVAVRVLDCTGSGSYSQIIAGVNWVTAHAVKPAVANMSLGGPTGSTLDTAVKNSIASGVTYAVAAGNDSTDACTVSPARLADAITVAATDATDHRASYSNYGTCVDIFAPGSNITSTYNSSDTATETMSGTSMATPHVTGAAAVYLSAHPTATPAQVRTALVNAAATGKVIGAGTGTPNKLLQVTAGAQVPCRVSTGTDLRIPDLSTVYSPLTVACTGTASATTTVTVSVKHPYPADVSLVLVAPDGSQYSLKHSGSVAVPANISATYTVNASAESRAGVWKLRVADARAGNVGYLDSWSLTV